MTSKLNIGIKRRFHAPATLAGFLAVSPGCRCTKRGITEKDFFDFRWIGDIQPAPNASKVVFAEATVAPAHDGYQTALYVLDIGTPDAAPVALLPNARHDTSPRWSPDGTRQVFLRSVEWDGHPSPTQLT